MLNVEGYMKLVPLRGAFLTVEFLKLNDKL